MENVTIIGIDSATKSKRTGLVLASYDPTRCAMKIEEVWNRKGEVLQQLLLWIKPDRKILLSIDCPMGWPESFGQTLKGHRAGTEIKTKSPENFFYRQTDLFIRDYFKFKNSKLQPFSVASDRIGKTAFATLNLINKVNSSGRNFKLVWNGVFKDGIIEVYPAATIEAYGESSKDYKNNANRRDGLFTSILRERKCKISLDEGQRTSIIESDHAFDAFICCLAAVDFLNGDSFPPLKFDGMKNNQLLPPELESVKEKEGWIWVVDPGK